MATVTEEISVKLGISTAVFNTAMKEVGVALKKAGTDAEATAGGLDKLDAGFTKMVKTLEVAAVAGFAKSLLSNADALEHMSQNLGINVETLQAFQAEVRAANGTNEDAQKILTTVRLKLDELRAGNETVTGSFASLGLKVRDFQGLSLEQSLVKIAAAYNENSDRAGAYAALQDLVGKGGKNLMDVLVDLGEKGLDPMIAKWKEAGTVIDEITVKQLAKANQEFEKMALQLQVGASSILGGISSAMAALGRDAAALVNSWNGIATAEESAFVTIKKLQEATGYIAGMEEAAAASIEEGRGSLVLTAKQKKELADLDREYFKAWKAAEKEQEEITKEAIKLNGKLSEAKFKLLSPSAQLNAMQDEYREITRLINEHVFEGNDLLDAKLRKAELELEIQEAITKETYATAQANKVVNDAVDELIADIEREEEALENLYKTSLRKTGGDKEELSDVQLAALRQRVQSNLDQFIRSDSMASGINGAYKSPQQYQAAQELAQIKAEQQIRADFAHTLQTFGKTYAEQHYAPDVFERLSRLIDPQIAKQQAKDISTITTVLKRTFDPDGRR